MFNDTVQLVGADHEPLGVRFATPVYSVSTPGSEAYTSHESMREPGGGSAFVEYWLAASSG